MSIIRKKMKGTHLVSYPYSFLDVSSVLKMFKMVNNRPGPEGIKLFSCSTQLSMKFYPAHKC